MKMNNNHFVFIKFLTYSIISVFFAPLYLGIHSLHSSSNKTYFPSYSLIFFFLFTSFFEERILDLYPIN